MSSQRADDRGSATLELAVLGPVLLVLLGLVVVAGRLEAAAGAVEQAAAAGARAASSARTAAGARAAAEDSVRHNLSGQRVVCDDLQVAVDTGGFRVAVGRAAEVVVRVSCRIPLSDQAVPGLPGSRQVDAQVVSPLDAYRAR